MKETTELDLLFIANYSIETHISKRKINCCKIIDLSHRKSVILYLKLQFAILVPVPILIKITQINQLKKKISDLPSYLIVELLGARDQKGQKQYIKVASKYE
ncbi:hypothetical protein TTHERM_00062680 (macronuclear) [Tetrahymena thermophila SB210]|uniref:Uncharacterized protein n=1 Tax=Tetrahymena thermophila (strain SB210) TaxID=312017 RepID=I7M6X8_TETTS|nr:hypothetical protein TTHERM_00062680 [Tetrahymena thermophila SB210]EAR87458.1 hypothetical protein TTHERM_00062680 [Tetrahymena thermophila SB210]|eukprot:XP_001007703.1 hypothetical protein TTHERM_00062680 [Tetrahymena thermophila SB210]